MEFNSQTLDSPFKLGCQSGFSLIDILIIMGILSMLSFTIATVTTNGQKVVKNQTESTQFNSLIAMLQSSTQSDSSCTAMFNINGNATPITPQQGSTTHLPVALGNTILAGTSPTPTAISGVSPVSQYGNLSIQDIYLTVTSPSPIPIASDSPVVNINANLIVVANKSTTSTALGSGQLSNVNSPIPLTLQVSSVSGPTCLSYTQKQSTIPGNPTINYYKTCNQWSAPCTTFDNSNNQVPVCTAWPGQSNSSTMSSCTGLRVGNSTQFNLPVCGAGQVLTSNGTELSCMEP